MSSSSGAPAGLGKAMAMGLVARRGCMPRNGATNLPAPPADAVTMAPMPASAAICG